MTGITAFIPSDTYFVVILIICLFLCFISLKNRIVGLINFLIALGVLVPNINGGLNEMANNPIMAQFAVIVIFAACFCFLMGLLHKRS
jgi:lipopolysaccharide export LptBFGC system permease protein LptF